MNNGEAIVGLLLGDCNASRRNETGNTDLRFGYGLAIREGKAYAIPVHSLLETHCRADAWVCVSTYVDTHGT